MEIFTCSKNGNNADIVEGIASFDWSAAKFLSELIQNGKLEETLGGWAELYVLADGDETVSFVTLSRQDCIADENLQPWLGFFFTAPNRRMKGYGRRLLNYACDRAKEKGYETVYLATDHVGLYEKMGFKYVENRIDVYGEDSRLYKRNLSVEQHAKQIARDKNEH